MKVLNPGRSNERKPNMSETEHLGVLDSGDRVTPEDIRELTGAVTPHFSLQLRNRVRRLIAAEAGEEAINAVAFAGAETLTQRARALVLEGVTSHLAPGHTPGCLVFRLAGVERDVLFTGDAAKNRAELVSGDTDMTYDAAVSRATIAMIWRLWRARPGTVLVPGHDVPMVQEDGVTAYLGPREAAIRAWFGDGMDQTTLFELTV